MNITLGIVFGFLLAILIFSLNTPVLGKVDDPGNSNSNSLQDQKENKENQYKNNEKDENKEEKERKEKKDHEKMTICHGTGSSTNPFVKITVSKNADNGHFNTNGTPRVGHLNDILLSNPNDDCPDKDKDKDKDKGKDKDRDKTKPTPTPTPNETPTPSPSSSPTATPAPGSTPTPTPTSTSTTTSSIGGDITVINNNENSATGGDSSSSSTSSSSSSAEGGSSTVNVTQTGGGQIAGVSVKRLPDTGVPLLAWSVLALLPLGFRMKKFKGDTDSGETPNEIWKEKQVKNILH